MKKVVVSMAERRMFAKTIVLSDAFLDMPLSARCLYFTLGMFADDDGFVNSPKGIMRQAGCSEDDLKVLLAKKFVLAFDTGVIVIKHWQINNYLRNDRYSETKYLEEKSTLAVDENGAYTMSGIPNNGIPSIGEDRIVQDSINTTSFDSFWLAYPKKVGKQVAMKSFERALKKTDLDTMLKAIDAQKQSDQWRRANGRYIPNPATWLNQGRWDDVISGDSGQDNGSRWKLRVDVE